MRVTMTATLPAVSLTASVAFANCSVLPIVGNGTTCENTGLTEASPVASPL